ncbi:hypothetical protein MPLB_280082 [Mesorhizobium sp. ORS 3324]|nr:hypothetical protein MPLB_280082 [Mesorhizobium sp. ORS 3324]
MLFPGRHLISPVLERAHRLAVRTPPSHGGNRGSIPLGRTKLFSDFCARLFDSPGSGPNLVQVFFMGRPLQQPRQVLEVHRLGIFEQL